MSDTVDKQMFINELKLDIVALEDFEATSPVLTDKDKRVLYLMGKIREDIQAAIDDHNTRIVITFTPKKKSCLIL